MTIVPGNRDRIPTRLSDCAAISGIASPINTITFLEAFRFYDCHGRGFHCLDRDIAIWAIGDLNLAWRRRHAVDGIARVPRSFQNDTALKRLEAASQTGLASAHKHKFREDCNDTSARDRLGLPCPIKCLHVTGDGYGSAGIPDQLPFTGLAAVPARFALERQAWNEAAALEPRNSQFPQAEAITYFARAIGSARGGDLAAAQEGVDKLKELRATLEKANQSYWTEQVEIQMLAASAWIAQAKGQKEEALKFHAGSGRFGG